MTRTTHELPSLFADRPRRRVHGHGRIAASLLIFLGLLTALRAAEPEKALAGYRAELAACRAAHGGSYDVPDVKFFLFGMGARTKLLYREGILFDARSGRELQRWKVRREIIVPPDYLVSWTAHWSDESGRLWRGQHTEIANRSEPVRIHPWERAATWGRAIFQ
jgi:hypothetical protein